jgi:hypothetical protein
MLGEGHDNSSKKNKINIVGTFRKITEESESSNAKTLTHNTSKTNNKKSSENPNKFKSRNNEYLSVKKDLKSIKKFKSLQNSKSRRKKHKQNSMNCQRKVKENNENNITLQTWTSSQPKEQSNQTGIKTVDYLENYEPINTEEGTCKNYRSNSKSKSYKSLTNKCNFYLNLSENNRHFKSLANTGSHNHTIQSGVMYHDNVNSQVSIGLGLKGRSGIHDISSGSRMNEGESLLKSKANKKYIEIRDMLFKNSNGSNDVDKQFNQLGYSQNCKKYFIFWF